MHKTYSIKESAEILKVAAVTLRLWERQGKITSSRTPGGQRRYSEEDLAHIRSLINRPRIQSPLTPPAPQPKLHTIAKTAKILGVSAVTLRLWERQGKISSSRTIGGQRRYTQDDINNIRSLANQPRIQSPTTPPAPRPKFRLTFPQKRILSATLAALIISATGFTATKTGLITSLISKPRMNYELSNIVHGAVLASQTALEDLRFTVNIPALFKKPVTIEGDLTAPNILYGLKPGTGINITPGQTPTISATDQTADLKIFKGIKVGSDTISAGSKIDTLELVAGDNVTLSANTSDKKITIKSAVTDVTTSGWTDDGTIVRLTTSGDLVALGVASGAARLNLNVDDSRDLLTASKSGDLKFKLTADGIISSGTWNGTIINESYGGTNQSSYATGDILYASSTNTLSKLPIGSTNQLLVVSGGIPAWTSNPSAGGSGIFGYWQRNAGTLSPTNITDDFLIGGTSTASAAFSVNSSTGSVIVGNSGTLTLPNSNTLTGQSGNVQFSGGISIGGGSTYYINTSGNANFGALNASTTSLAGTTVTSLTDSGSASVSGALTLYGTPTISTTSMQSLTLGNANTGSIILTNAATLQNGLTVSLGTVSLPNGQIDNVELANSAITVSGGNSITTSGSPVSLGGTVTVSVTNDSIGDGQLAYDTGQTLTTASSPTFTGLTLSGLNTAGAVVYTDTNGVLGKTAQGSAGQVLSSNGTGSPTWVDSSTLSDSTWQRNLGVIAPRNITDDLIIGGIATSSALFQISGITGNASTSGTLTFGSTPTISTTSMRSLTLGDANTGNIVLANAATLQNGLTVSSGTVSLPNGQIDNVELANSSVTITAGTGLSGGGAVSLGSAVTLTNAGVTSATGTTNQVNVSASTGAVTFSLPQSIATTSDVTFNNLSLGGSATVSGGLALYGTPTISTTGMQSLTLGDANTGNIVTSHNIAATGTLTGLTGLTVSSGTVSLPNGQIDNVELANSTITVSGGNSITTSGSPVSLGGTVTVGVTNDSIGDTQLAFNTGQDLTTASYPTFVELTLSSLNTAGAVVYADATGILNKTAQGISGQILTSGGTGSPTWVNASTLSDPMWQRNAGTVSPLNITDDLLVGGISTAAATLRLSAAGTITLPNSNTLTGVSGYTQHSGGVSVGGGTTYYIDNLGTANLNGLTAGTTSLGTTAVTSLTNTGSASVSGALTLYTTPTIATTAKQSLTLGNSNTGDIVFANAAVANSTLAFPNSNTLSGVTNYLQLSQGISVGGNTTYYVNSAGSANLNALTVNSSASISGALTLFGSPTIATTGKQSLTLGNTDTGNIVLNSFSTGVLLTNTSGAISYSNGTNDQVLTISGGVPSWGTVSGSSCTDCLITDPSLIQTITPTANVTGLRIAQASAGTADVFSVTNNGSTTKYFAIDSSGNATASGNLTLDSAATIQTTNNQSLTLGGGQVLLNSVPLLAPLPVSIADTALNGALRQSLVDAINDVYTLASGGSSPTSYWQLVNKVVSPSNSTFDLALGNTATSSAKFQIFGTSGNATTSGNLTFDSGIINTTRKQTLTLGDANTGNISLANPVSFLGLASATAGLDVTTSNLTVGGSNFTVAPASGNITTTGTLTLPNSNTLTGVSGYTKLSGGVSVGGGTTYYIDNLGTANLNGLTAGTTSLGTTTVTSLTNTGSASVSGALTLYTTPTIATTSKQSLTLGNADTGNIIFANPAVANSTLAFPNSNTLSGVTNYLQLSQGVSFGGDTTYYVNSAGSANLNALTLAGILTANASASVSGTLSLFGPSIIATTGMQSLTLGDANTGNIVTGHNISASGTLTGLSGLTVSSGTVSLPNGQIDNVELANSSVTITAGTGLSGGGAVSLGSAVTLTNAGVTSATGTTNQVNVSASTGAVTFSLPQSIATTSDVTFNNLSLGGSATVSGGLALYGTPTISTTGMQSLTLGDSNTGNVIFNAGNVGIGTTTPGAKFGIAGNAIDFFRFDYSNDPAGYNLKLSQTVEASNVYWNFTQTNADTNYNVLTFRKGNAGIGTTNPLAKLDVNGTASVSGALSLYGTPTIATTAKQSLTLGDSNTGNILLNSGNVIVANNISAANLSGSNTGDQTITLTGDITGSGTGSFATTIGALKVTNSMLAGGITEVKGGTGQSTYTTGDLLYSSATDTLAKLGIGTADKVLAVSTGLPTWVDVNTLTNTYWQRNSGAVSPSNITDDLLIGAISTASAKLSVISSSGNLTTTGTITLPNTNTLTGVSGYIQASGGLSVGGGTTYYISNVGVSNLAGTTVSALTNSGATTLTGALTAQSTASVSGGLTLYGTPSISTTAKQSLTLGDSNTGNIIFNAGNVGIGTTTPGAKFGIAGSATDFFRFDYTSEPTTYNLKLSQTVEASNVYWNFIQRNANTDYNVLTLMKGNVGIGSAATTSATLDVVGDMKLGTGSTRWRMFNTNQMATTNNCDTTSTGAVDALCWDSTDTTGTSEMRLQPSGNLTITGTLAQSTNADIAEQIEVDDPSIVPGDILIAATILPEDGRSAIARTQASKSHYPYQPSMIGVVSSSPAILMGIPDAMALPETNYAVDGTRRSLSLAGRIPVNIASDSTSIRAGDYLTSSNTAGKAMKATRPGPMVGKALEDWTPGSGKTSILTFLNVSWADPNNNMTFDDNGNLAVNGTVTAKDVILSPTPVIPGLSSLQDQIASISAQLAILNTQNSILNTPLNTENWSYATASGKLMTTLLVQVPELTITGKLTVGLLSFDDLQASISSLTGTITIKGDLAVTGKIRVLGDSIGEATLASGSASLTIETSAASTTSSIFVTPQKIPVPVSAEATQEGQFVIRIPQSLSDDLKVKWWIVN